ncbi:hypothetical protein PANT_8c00069 [Moesziomyces antarcticus T-34]|uniref:Uncharacterized protein n=1 Tax=Pseudozyma antarctica (strain T-34) TaxID=1151754 RepID=M9ME34_PSEA3|nr:hypothetical protein PANT_8c00069 [Moesziomyces antarcticus T-34]
MQGGRSCRRGTRSPDSLGLQLTLARLHASPNPPQLSHVRHSSPPPPPASSPSFSTAPPSTFHVLTFLSGRATGPYSPLPSTSSPSQQVVAPSRQLIL